MPFLQLMPTKDVARNRLGNFLTQSTGPSFQPLEYLCVTATKSIKSTPNSNFIVQDTGLGIDRTKNVVFIGITSRRRTEEQKTNLYTKLVEELKACGIVQSDIVVSIVTNSDADWSFGNGRAQFLTGEL